MARIGSGNHVKGVVIVKHNPTENPPYQIVKSTFDSEKVGVNYGQKLAQLAIQTNDLLR